MRIQNTRLDLFSSGSNFQQAGGASFASFAITLDEPEATSPINNPNTTQSVVDLFGGAFDMNDFSSRTAEFYFGVAPFGGRVEMDLSNLTSSPASVSAVPIPAAVWLMGSGLVGLLGFRRKRT